MNVDAERETPAQSDVDPSSKTDKTALLIIRAWVEKGSPEPLRADVRVTTDVSAGIERHLTLAHAEEVGATVQAWLAEVLGEAAPESHRPTSPCIGW